LVTSKSLLHRFTSANVKVATMEQHAACVNTQPQ
jgi:hypothetical protein